MKLCRITACGDIFLISGNIKTADSFFRKLFGLIFSAPLKDNEGLLLYNCRSIHTFWMSYPIDVLFLDASNKVLRFFEDLKPFRVTPFVAGAKKTVEIKSGTIRSCMIKAGEYLRFF